MTKQRIAGAAKFRALAAGWGIGFFIAVAVLGAGCNHAPSEHSQLSDNADSVFLAGIRAPAGDTTRLLHNAHYLKLMGRPELAFRELEAAYHHDPANVRVLNALSLACDEMGDFTRAQKIYQQALKLDDSNQALNNNLCFSYYLSGQWDKAESCFRQALSKNSQNIMARNNLGLLLCRLGRSEEAHRLWREAEGEIAAQKKIQQVMVALGLGDSPRYAQLPEAAPAAPAPPAKAAPPLPEAAPAASTPPVKTSAPSPEAAPAAIPAKVNLPRTPEPQPQLPAPQPAKPRQSVKVAAASPAAASPEKKPDLVIAEKPVPPQPKKQVSAPMVPELLATPAPLAKADSGGRKAKPAATAPKPPAKPDANGTQDLLASPVPAPAPKAPAPPALPKQAVNPEQKPAPAASPPSLAQPGKIKEAAAPAPVRLTLEQMEKSSIAIVNAGGGSDLGRQMWKMLTDEGLRVVYTFNHREFRAEDTVIYYRPGSEGIARALNAKYFPKSRLEIGDNFARGADIKILLGKDGPEPAALADKSAVMADKIAAGPAPDLKEPKAVTAAAAPAAVAPPIKAPAPPAAADTVKTAAPDSKYLTAAELETMAVEIRNGTPAPDLARKTRAMLSEEGFNVARIGNHIDWGAEKTVIYYRPGAEKMARNLSARFFANSPTEQTASLPADVAVKVLLGKDLVQRPEVMAKLND